MKAKNKRLVKALLSIGVVTALLTGCKSSGKQEEVPATAGTDKTTQTASEDKETSSAGDAKAAGIYMLNSKPEYDSAWQELAKEYSEKTGIEVRIESADGKQYYQTLESELAAGQAPTIYMLSNPSEAQALDAYIYDLKETSMYSHLTDKSLCIQNQGKVAALPYYYSCFGIIYNKQILSDYCSLDRAVINSAEEIRNINTLMEVAIDINNRKEELNDEFGYDLTGAFASSGLDSESSRRFSEQLASLPLYYEFKDDACDLLAGEEAFEGKYLEQFKTVWDMYISTSGADPRNLANGALDSEMELGTHEAVFYQNGDWEFEALTNPENEYFVEEDDLGMLPIFFGISDNTQGLSVGSDCFLAVNSKAESTAIDAALDFLDWVITSDEGRLVLTHDMKVSSPYDTFTGEYASANAFMKDNDRYLSEGKESLAWSYLATPNAESWRAWVVEALMAYTDGSGDWADVKSAFVDGWEIQWKAVHR